MSVDDSSQRNNSIFKFELVEHAKSCARASDSSSASTSACEYNTLVVEVLKKNFNDFF